MSTPPSPSWLQRLASRLVRLGPLRLQWAGALLALLIAAAGAFAVAWFTAARQPLWAAVLSGGTCALLSPWMLAGAIRLWNALADAEASALGAAPTDVQTGVLTRQHFMQLAERELARCRRYHTPGALLLIDADHFKRLNETHGRACGDAVLREICRLTQELLRQADLLARFGGEELIVFLPHTDPLGALDVADRIRERIGELRLTGRGQEVRVTVSIGVAAVEAGHTSMDLLVHEADAALFAAKEAGRNCVRAAPIRPRHSGEPRRVSARK